MMSFSNDLNLLAANNVIGYDTYSQTLSGMGVRPQSRYNPYGVGVLNTGVSKDTYTGLTTIKSIRSGILSACGFAIGTRIISEFQRANNEGKTSKETIQAMIQEGLGLKNKAKVKTAPKGFKAVMAKIGKGAKITAIAAGVGAAVFAAGKLILGKNNYQPTIEITENGQPKQEE